MPDPETMTLSQMRRQRARQLRQIGNYAKGGDGQINRERLQKAIDRYLNSRTVRALAIAETERVGVEEMAERANALRAEMDASLPWDEALANCCKHIRWNYRPKSTPGVRQVCSLPTHLKAWNKITNRLIEAIHSTEPHIADWRGRGRDWQIKQITDVLTRSNLSVVVADVTNAFASVQPDALYQFLNLPDELIRGRWMPGPSRSRKMLRKAVTRSSRSILSCGCPTLACPRWVLCRVHRHPTPFLEFSLMICPIKSLRT